MTPLPGIELGSHERESYTRSGLRPLPWGLGKQCTPRQRPIPVWQLPRRTGVHLPTPAAPIHPYPHRRPLPPINARRDNPLEQSYHIPLTPPLAPPPPQLPTQSQYSSPPSPPRPTTPRRGLGTIDLSEDVPPPPPPRPVYQSFPFHPSIMDETGLFSKGTQRTIDRFVTDIGGRDLSRRFKGVFNSETVTSLDIINDPVIFAEIFRSRFAALPS